MSSSRSPTISLEAAMLTGIANSAFLAVWPWINDFDIKEVHRERIDGLTFPLYRVTLKSAGRSFRRQPLPVPNHLDIEHQHSLFFWNSCDASVYLTIDILFSLLQGHIKKLERRQAELSTVKRAYRGTPGNYYGPPNHAVMVVELLDGRAFVVDFTLNQFGNNDMFCELEQYERKYVYRWAEISRYGSDELGKLLDRNVTDLSTLHPFKRVLYQARTLLWKIFAEWRRMMGTLERAFDKDNIKILEAMIAETFRREGERLANGGS